MREIGNEFLSVIISEKGAEPQSIKSKKTGTEYLWQRDPQYWPMCAPVLFPIVGTLKDDEFFYGGVKYNLQKHGFARHSVFECVSADETSAVFSLNYSDETLVMYPFKFRFELAFRVEGNSLHTDYITYNLADKDLLYSAGAHEAYNCPRNADESFTDYYIEFEKQESFETYLTIGNGLITGEKVKLEGDGKILRLNHELFKNDALAFKNLNSSRVWLKSDKSGASVEVNYPGTQNMFIWTKVGAPYVCIEPWWGIPDPVDTDKDFTKKEGLMTVMKGEKNTVSHVIRINE